MDSFETDSIEIAADVALGLCSEVERLSQQLQDARTRIRQLEGVNLALEKDGKKLSAGWKDARAKNAQMQEALGLAAACPAACSSCAKNIRAALEATE